MRARSHWHSMPIAGIDILRRGRTYRTHENSTQIVSGLLARPNIRLDALSSCRVAVEMERFILKFNQSRPDGQTPLKLLPCCRRSALV